MTTCLESTMSTNGSFIATFRMQVMSKPYTFSHPVHTHTHTHTHTHRHIHASTCIQLWYSPPLTQAFVRVAQCLLLNVTQLSSSALLSRVITKHQDAPLFLNGHFPLAKLMHYSCLDRIVCGKHLYYPIALRTWWSVTGREGG